MLPLILTLFLFTALPPHSAIVFNNLEDAQSLELHIHEAMIADGAIQERWCEIRERKVLWWTEYAVVIEQRVEQYLTPEEKEQIETLDDSWFPESEEE